MVYNLTNYTAANDFLGMSVAANDLVGGWMFPFLLALMFCVVFLSLKNYPTIDALLTASFVCFFLSVPLWVLGLITGATILIIFVALLFAVVVKVAVD